MNSKTAIHVLSVLLALFLLTACDDSDTVGGSDRLDDIPADLGRQLTALNTCEAAADCLLIGLQCDIGCFVDREEEQQARQIAAEIDKIAPRDCDNPGSSAFPPDVECSGGRCIYPGSGAIGDPLAGCYYLSQF